ncbi:Integrin alpha-6 CD49 antigen-like family member F VLA-6 [Solea senegalensis]|uniref:Integrin alpha-6 CD49 antigen-like family member F VLA-6 n=1 Tax=Solea senegalensis TaxID=28829 RepID=A0AAV6SM61_SOLSE|nr:Integrin alpha-6 CD49 antigen-like family member F VLA-6 [Solea senegalensis]
MSFMVFNLVGAAVTKLIRRLMNFLTPLQGSSVSENPNVPFACRILEELHSEAENTVVSDSTLGSAADIRDALTPSRIPVFVYKPIYVCNLAHLSDALTATEQCSSFETQNFPNTDLSKDQFKVSDPRRPNYKCASICRFSNEFLNCWMNAALQAVLNLNLVQDISPDSAAEPITPTFGELFLTALAHPGRFFSQREVYMVLQELNDAIPYLRLGQDNDVLDFLQPLLVWLEGCGVKTMIKMDENLLCKQCGFTSTDITNTSIYFLSPPFWGDSIASLLQSSLNGSAGLARCEKCDRIDQKISNISFPDVLTLHLPRTQGPSREPVAPSRIIELMQHPKTQRFSLASVICHNSSQTHCGHYWSYVIKDDVIIQVNDDDVSIAKSLVNLYCDGLIYFYERCS